MESKKSARALLSAPLRVYWDLAPPEDGGISGETARKASEELASLKVFFVTLTLSGRPRKDLGGIVENLKKGGSRVTLSVGVAESMPGPEVLQLADGIDLRPADEGALNELLAAVPAGRQAMVSLTPERGGAGKAGPMIKAALDAGVRTFSLANPNIIYDRESAPRFVLGAADRKAYSDILEGLLKPFGNEAKLFVHDLFLHRTLKLPGLGGRIEYAGCQAGDAIAFIDRAGVIYPCATFPVPMGELGRRTLKEVWASAERQSLRERITAAPAECADCGELTECKGGCRGLAWEIAGREGKDPNCGG